MWTGRWVDYMVILLDLTLLANKMIQDETLPEQTPGLHCFVDDLLSLCLFSTTDSSSLNF